MKNTIRLLTIMILMILGVVMTIIAFAMSTTVNKDAITEKNKSKILEDYTALTTISSTNNEIRDELTTKLITFSIESYPEEHEEYVELLNKYNENITTITNHTIEMDKKCSKKIDDARIEVVCRSYKMLYEDVVNTYITNVNEYNNKIKTYNETAATPYNEFEPIKKEYIDYDKDGSYLGKPNEK